MRVESLLEHGSGVMNEDFLVAEGNLFGVFDGATSLSAATYENGHTGGFLAASIVGETFRENRGTVVEMAARANQALWRAMQERNVDLSDKGNLWSTSAAVVRLGDGILEWALIGDCRILCVHDDGGHELLCDVPDQDVETLSLWKDIGRSTDDPIGIAMHDQILKVRSRMNVDYGVFSGEPESMRFLQSGTHALQGVSHVLLFTDGLLLPEADPRRKRGFGEQVELFRKAGLKGLRDRIRSIEATDVGCRAYPRFKTHDDIAAIAIAP